ncbi:MAG: iron-sulfur cluster assembly protein [Weeksellaceae bacterium]|jgi:FeS assembly SUF system protein|nr:iron-sulfur cluster assembly protein [Weeksellaceae bacterium]
MGLTQDRIDELSNELVEVFKSIYDPEIPVDIYELGLIYDAEISQEGKATVTMTLTTPNCPVAESLPMEVKERVSEVEGITDAEVILTFEPPWDRDMMSEEAKFDLGFL